LIVGVPLQILADTSSKEWEWKKWDFIQIAKDNTSKQTKLKNFQIKMKKY